MINFKFISVLTFLYFLRNIEGAFKEKQWISDLCKYIQKSNNYETVLFVDNEDNNTKYLKIMDLVSEISTNIPSRVIDFKKVTEELEKSRFLNIIRQSEIIIIIHFCEINLFKKVDILNELSGSYKRPKCLIILIDGEETIYEELLHYAWSKKFLDFTILELPKGEKRSDNFLKNSLNDYPFETARLYYFNPFNQAFINETYSTKSQFFPDKLHNLNGYELKVGSFSSPPVLYVKRNASGYPISVFGVDAEVLKVTSQHMNFTISEFASQQDWFGKNDCDKNKTEGLLRKLLYNEIQLFTNEAISVYECENHLRELGFGLSEVICYTWVTPIIQKSKSSASFTMNRFYVLLVIIFLVFLVWIAVYFLKFEMQFWPLFYIFEAVFGLTVPREPQKFLERIVFCFILFAFYIHSSSLFAMLTDFTVTPTLELKADTLQDLYNSNFTPVVRENSLSNSEIMNDEMLHNLLRKVVKTPTFDMCIKKLLRDRNVACFMVESMAKFFLKRYKQGSNKPLMGIGKDCILRALSMMIYEPGSPFLRGIDRVVPRLRESGLIQKWRQDINPVSEFMEESNLSRSHVPEIIETTLLIHVLKTVLATGYILAILAFIGEILFNYIKAKVN